MNRPVLKIGDSLIEHINDLNRYIDQLEKTLDKACEMLTELTSDCNIYKCPFNCGCDCSFECENKENWKEWCMRDEE